MIRYVQPTMDYYYLDNSQFKEFVDNYCNEHDISVTDALHLKVVEDYLLYLLNCE